MDNMTAVVWVLVALVGGTLGLAATALLGASGRIDGIAGRIDGITGRIDGITGRIDTMSGRVDALGTEVNGRFDGLHEDVREVRGELRDLRTAVVNLDRRLTVAGG